MQAAEGSVDQALATYQQSIKDHPRDIALYILAGEMYASQENGTRPSDMYQKALAIQSDNPLASNNLAYLMLQRGGNVDVALAMAQTACRGMPDSPNAADTLGLGLLSERRLPVGHRNVPGGLRLNLKSGGNDDPAVHYHLALAYQRNRSTLAGPPATRACAEAQPQRPDARKTLSELRG